MNGVTSVAVVRLFVAGCLLAAVWERERWPGSSWAGVVAIVVLGGGLVVWLGRQRGGGTP